MALTPCKKKGKPGYQWNGSGPCYCYEDNQRSRRAAKAKAKFSRVMDTIMRMPSDEGRMMEEEDSK